MKRNRLSKLGLHYKPTGKTINRSHPKMRQKNQFLDKRCWNRLYKLKNTRNSRKEEEIEGGGKEEEIEGGGGEIIFCWVS
jgi:hypothetical protein